MVRGGTWVTGVLLTAFPYGLTNMCTPIDLPRPHQAN